MFKTHNLSRNSAVLFVVANHVDGVEVELKVGHLNTDRRNISVKLGFALSLQVLAGRRERWVVLGGGFAFAFSISRGSGSRHNEVGNGAFQRNYKGDSMTLLYRMASKRVWLRFSFGLVSHTYMVGNARTY